jgi:hypothetical protein
MKNMKEPPELIIATKPAELIVVDGPPDYQSIEGTSLLSTIQKMILSWTSIRRIIMSFWPGAGILQKLWKTETGNSLSRINYRMISTGSPRVAIWEMLDRVCPARTLGSKH